MTAISISLYLDKRKLLRSGKYPVKIQAASKEKGTWRQMFLSTGQEVSVEEWEVIRGKVRMNERLKDIKNIVLTRQARALEIVKDSPFISLDTLKVIFTGASPGGHLNVQNLYTEYIAKLQARGQYGTSMIYKCVAGMLLKKCGAGLTLNVIDKDFLENLESELTIARATIGIYMRTLRTIYNQAIARKAISRDAYPFGPGEYRVPTGTSFKRALTVKEKDQLVKYQPRSKEERRALDVWRVSYYCNGMNAADLARLERSDIRGDLLTYVRKKTARTEQKSRPLVVVIRKDIRAVLNSGSGKFIFGVLDGKETAEQERKKVSQWTKTTNKYLKRIGERLGLKVKLTTYVARHTAATQLLRSGASVVYIRDVLGHSSIETTENYLQSMDIDGQRKMTAKL